MTLRVDSAHGPVVAATAARPEDRPLALRDWVALSLPGLIWGSSFFLIAEGLESFEPFLVTWLRIMFGLLVIASVPATREPVPRAAWPRLAVLGVVWVSQRGSGFDRPEYPFALASWCTFAALVITRVVYGWRGRRAARFTLVGFGTAILVLAIYLVRRIVE